VAPDLAPLIAEKDLELDIETMTASVNAHGLMLGEWCLNLLHNAIKENGPDGALRV
jgi:two-component system sensor histidine kinase TctE